MSAPSTFHDLLGEQIGHEFAASHQYVAIAVWYDQQALEHLAGFFYAQALEERNHAMMIVKYLMDRDAPVVIPAIPAVQCDFASIVDPIELALGQERRVTAQFERLIATARGQSDFIGEQFTHWFLKEQVEEVASMSTLLTVAKRCVSNPMLLEDYLSRRVASEGGDSTAPDVAGGPVG